MAGSAAIRSDRSTEQSLERSAFQRSDPALAFFERCIRLHRLTFHEKGYGRVQTPYFVISLGLLVSIPAAVSGLADWTEIKREKPAWSCRPFRSGWGD